MKNTRQLTLIWAATGLLLLIGIVLLVLMFLPGANNVFKPTPNAFEKGASVTVTIFVLPPTWTALPVQNTEPSRAATANPLSTSTRAVLIMPTQLPTQVITYRVIPSLTQGPTQTRMPTTTHYPMTVYPTTATVSIKPSATKKP